MHMYEYNTCTNYYCACNYISSIVMIPRTNNHL